MKIPKLAKRKLELGKFHKKLSKLPKNIPKTRRKCLTYREPHKKKKINYNQFLNIMSQSPRERKIPNKTLFKAAAERIGGSYRVSKEF